MSRADKLLAIIMLAAVGAAIYAAAVRWRAEMPNRTVALVLDWQEVEALAAAEGVTVRRALQELRRAGATHVAVGEQHLSDLVASGRVGVLPPAVVGLGEDFPGEAVVLSALDLVTAHRLRDHLSAKLPSGAIESPAGEELPPDLIPCHAPQAYLETLGLGWPLEQPLIAAEAGLGVVARVDNYPGARQRAITFMVAQAAAVDAALVIFARDQVLGHPGLIGETAAALQAAELTYGLVELAGQLGDRNLGRALDGEVVRVHSIPEGEIIAFSPQMAVARYVRAVKERGIRACYLRLFLGPRERLLECNRDYVGALRSELQAAGYGAGSPRPLPPVSIPVWALMLLAAGAVAAAVFALGRVMPLPEWAAYLLLIVGVGAGAGLLVIAPGPMRAEKALLAAMAFPGIALIAVARGARADRAAPEATPAGLVARAGAWLIGASIISGAGGLVVAGLLTQRLYMVKVLQFAGVKLALGVPLLVVGVVWALGLRGGVGGAAYRERVQENFRRLWNRSVCVWEVALAAVVAAAAVVVLMRSGNQPAFEVWGLEMRARSLLEQVFFARPRTKEFLVGYPALMLAVAMALRGRKRWVLALLLVGAVGQASLVNTFCHLHSPVFVCLLRSTHGLWLGLAAGAVAVWLWDRLRGADVAGREEEQTTGS